ncbi:MAG: peptidase M20 [Candidatus Marinimicrobia bacterium]|jgi:acetylornithine deacetylase/succinyl-diaminopimelate desuccinylase-like protein|nr:peptidase M20 [Candidatus Neomarinimicrobiota bacterium]|tara:strand:+ start:727 stop:2136 length:1410 start_codon:yes stop_codon:yes gene_type:complete
MNSEKLQQDISTFWDNQILPTIIEYIKFPNKSPVFDPDWEANGYMDQVVDLASDWVNKHKPDNSTLNIYKEAGRTPLMILDVPGNSDGTVLMYGHLDKQPEMEGWAEGLDPWKPVLKDDKLYGRGGADDGYAIFASVCTVNALLDQGISLPRIVILIECSEESGSPDLPFYMDHCADVIGSPDLVICLDSGAGNYEQFWTTTSLRGLIGCTLRVDILKEGIHSGGGSGIAPSSFRLVRELLSRLEDEDTGHIIVENLKVEIPEYRIKEIKAMVNVLGDEVYNTLPWVAGAGPITNDKVEMVMNNTWLPMLSVVAADGLPGVKDGGNVLRPYTTIKLSLRIPPTLDANAAQNIVEELFTSNPPYGAAVSMEFEEPATGWEAPPLAQWLDDAIQHASETVYSKPALAMGEGGTIPFMSMLGEKFPEAQFVITGVLGPYSNAHGPNEFLHIPYAKKLTSCVGMIIQAFTQKR